MNSSNLSRKLSWRSSSSSEESSILSTSSSTSGTSTSETRSTIPSPLPLEVIEEDFIGAEIQITASTSGVVPDDTFTVTEAVNSLGFGKFQIILSFVTGLCWMSDSMEMMVLSILSPALHCEWGIDQMGQAFLTTVVFIGMMGSAMFWGKVSDTYGRKTALILAAGFMSCVGFNIGCVPQAVTLFAEFLPTKQRGKCVVLLDCFWALGACLTVVLAAWIMPSTGNWRLFLALTSVPPIIFVVLALIWLPESARYNAAIGKTDKALKTLQKIASDNGVQMIRGRLIVDDVHLNSYEVRGRFSDLLKSDLRMTSIILWLIWMTGSFVYYGIVFMTTELFETPDIVSLCRSTNTQSLAEFPGIMITIFLVERFERKNTLALEFFLLTASLCLLFRCSGDRTYITGVLFFVRGIGSGVFQAAYLYTPEVYPTILRSVGLGTCSGMARFGAMLTPYVAQVLVKKYYISAISIYVTVAAMATIGSLFLPAEKRGKELVRNEH
ncbi:Putative transporter svop-1,Synaptic vesicle 2-related protein [Lepeophtheirus salmonis]|uniref:Transporter svop-1,Synaptic vesicle 2-related protein n=1 Tax=Lepeophtheirus salmonis TaxID=72036 RepID=A0A7R8D0J7_LEPSM|nr:Putative transporter svop-1,Synaptic vesicle 2-related protein [Lepeophtheirus salmonis]CAF2984685.1 Putative transporter svop-1,Synaptic vesicle 2-related protein [Lepeophtheirus salmonis]